MSEASDLISSVARKIGAQLEQIVFGQQEAIELLLIGLLSEGHVLMEGLPGTAKTTLVKALSQLVQADFKRIQLTPDMLPAEITGTSVYDLNARNFTFKPGPVFTDLLLADEINRTPPKTQSALLESMEEQQVTIDGVCHALPSLFTVIATLNPVEFEGTYPLPEAQLDRFMMKIVMHYPPQEAERQMMTTALHGTGLRSTHHMNLSPLTKRDEILHCRHLLNQIRVDDAVLDYILLMIRDTRSNPNVDLGCSPRSALALLAAARAHAAVNGTDFVTPDNVKAVAPAVMRHRLILSAEAELDGLTTDQVIKHTLGKIPVPR